MFVHTGGGNYVPPVNVLFKVFHNSFISLVDTWPSVHVDEKILCYKSKSATLVSG